MASEWFYSKNGQRFGPVSGQKLKELAAKGELGAGDHVWKAGMTEWLPASKVKGLLPTSTAVANAPPSPPTPTPLEQISTSDMLPAPVNRRQAGMSTKTKVLVLGGVALVGVCLVGTILAVSGWVFSKGKTGQLDQPVANVEKKNKKNQGEQPADKPKKGEGNGPAKGKGVNPITEPLVLDTGSTWPVQSVLFSPDSRFVFARTHDKAGVWELKTGKTTPISTQSGTVIAYCFSPDSTQLLFIGQRKKEKEDQSVLRVLDLRGGGKSDIDLDAKTQAGGNPHNAPQAFASWSRDTKVLAVLSNAHVIEFYTRADERAGFKKAGSIPSTALDQPGKKLAGYPIYPHALSLSPDGKYLAVAAVWGSRIYSVPDGQPLAWASERPVNLVDFSHDSRFWVVEEQVDSSTYGRNKVIILEAPKWQAKFLLQTQGVKNKQGIELATLTIGQANSHFRRWAFSPDNGLIAANMRRRGSPAEAVGVWETANGKCLYTFPAQSCEDLIFTPDGKLLVTGGDYNHFDNKKYPIELRDALKGSPQGMFVETSAFNIAVSPDGRLAGIGNSRGKVIVRPLRGE